VYVTFLGGDGGRVGSLADDDWAGSAAGGCDVASGEGDGLAEVPTEEGGVDSTVDNGLVESVEGRPGAQPISMIADTAAKANRTREQRTPSMTAP
jgi:hypothetical protein